MTDVREVTSNELCSRNKWAADGKCGIILKSTKMGHWDYSDIRQIMPIVQVHSDCKPTNC